MTEHKYETPINNPLILICKNCNLIKGWLFDNWYLIPGDNTYNLITEPNCDDILIKNIIE